MASSSLFHLIAKVDTKLFKTIEFKDFKTSNVQYSNKDSFLHSFIHKSVITLLHNEVKDSSIQASSNTSH